MDRSHDRLHEVVSELSINPHQRNMLTVMSLHRLNGRGVGARYDGTYNYNGQSSSYIGSCDGKYTGTVAGLDATYRDNIGKFIEAQLDGYEKAAGWIFWTWKTGTFLDVLF